MDLEQQIEKTKKELDHAIKTESFLLTTGDRLTAALEKRRGELAETRRELESVNSQTPLATVSKLAAQATGLEYLISGIEKELAQAQADLSEATAAALLAGQRYNALETQQIAATTGEQENIVIFPKLLNSNYRLGVLGAAAFGVIARFPNESSEATAARLGSRRADIAGSIRQLLKHRLIENGNKKNSFRLTKAGQNLIATK